LSDAPATVGGPGSFVTMNKQQLEQILTYLSETRWIEYGKQWPQHRVFVEAVLGKQIDWSQP